MRPNKHKHKTPPKQKQPAKTQSCDVEISRIGQHGYGMALVDGIPVTFPQTTLGDRVTAGIRHINKHQTEVENIKIVNPNETNRRKPPCPHHTTTDKTGCGGCSLQFLHANTYHEWKENLIKDCLRKAKVDTENTEFLPMISSDQHSRRRAVFSAVRNKEGISLGFFEQGSNTVYDWPDCLILCPELIDVKKNLYPLLESFLPPSGTARLHCSVIDSVVDIILIYKDELTQEQTVKINAWASEHSCGRISWAKDEHAIAHIIYEQKTPHKKCGSYTIPLPPAAFLQPSDNGEKALLSCVLNYLSSMDNIKRIMDLFCGLGTFTLPVFEALSDIKSFTALDINGASISNLHNTTVANPELSVIQVETRDLFKNPVSAKDLRKMDVVVIDPPRIGAKEQAIELAQSRVPHIIMVSCNPATMARDAKILCDGGYNLMSVTPVDQFLWTHHLETVALFSRK